MTVAVVAVITVRLVMGVLPLPRVSSCCCQLLCSVMGVFLFARSLFVSLNA